MSVSEFRQLPVPYTVFYVAIGIAISLKLPACGVSHEDLTRATSIVNLGTKCITLTQLAIET